ncbi:MAG: alkyl hydroperoxide reductase, partial [Dehalococcoidia bacterium]
HQIWSMQLAGGVIGPWAGSMAEGIVDGSRAQAELAQPSGLALGPEGLTFADSESSGVREVSFGGDGAVHTHIGEGLFHFGDADGSGKEVRLQHPLDVAWVGDELYVADTFNHKIKRVYPKTKTVSTICGGHGYADGPLAEARFDEPGGLCPGPDRTLIVADTNNHQIRIIDLEAKRVRTLDLKLDG